MAKSSFSYIFHLLDVRAYPVDNAIHPLNNWSQGQCQSGPTKLAVGSHYLNTLSISLVSGLFFKLGLRLFLGGGARPWVKEPSIWEFRFTMDSASPLFVFSTSSYNPSSSWITKENVKWRCGHHSCDHNLRNCEVARRKTKIRGLNGSQTSGFCVRAAVLYQGRQKKIWHL